MSRKALKDLGMRTNWIYEVLMETGGIHRAPMGVWTEDFETLVVDIYRDSSTYTNLKNDPDGVIYLIDDPRYLVESKHVDYFAKLNFRAVEAVPGNPTRFVCTIGEIKRRREGSPLNRAFGLFLEYLVDESRKKIDQSAAERVEYYKKTIRKVAPGSIYETLIDRFGGEDG